MKVSSLSLPPISLFLTLINTTHAWPTPGPLSVYNPEVSSSRGSIYPSFPCVLSALFLQKAFSRLHMPVLPDCASFAGEGVEVAGREGGS